MDHFWNPHMGGKKDSKDGGVTMMEALNYAKLEYACLGNHELLAALGLRSQDLSYLLVAVKSEEQTRLW